MAYNSSLAGSIDIIAVSLDPFKEVHTVFLTLPISMERTEFLSKRSLPKFASGFCARYLKKMKNPWYSG